MPTPVPRPHSHPQQQQLHRHALLLPDILHEIFPRLPCATLLACERVCRTWQRVISRSPLAQQRLFRVADPSALDALFAIEAHDVAEQKPAAFLSPQLRLIRRPEFRALFNPWVLRGAPFSVSWEAWLRSSDGAVKIWRITDRVSCGVVGFVMARKEFLGVLDEQVACWRTMFVVQPPVKRVVGWVRFRGGRKEAFEVNVEEGVRMSHVLKKVEQTGVVKGLRGMKMRGEHLVQMQWQFDEHFNGVKFFKPVWLERDAQGAVQVR
jgi:hypothetical protein